MNIDRNTRTFYTYLGIENTLPDLHKVLCLPFYVDSVELEVSYRYIEGRDQTQYEPEELPEIEILKLNVISCAIDSGKDVTISEKASLTIAYLIELKVDDQDIEVLCFEDAESWFNGEDE